jgi:hypothetical protein
LWAEIWLLDEERKPVIGEETKEGKKIQQDKLMAYPGEKFESKKKVRLSKAVLFWSKRANLFKMQIRKHTL